MRPCGSSSSTRRPVSFESSVHKRTSEPSVRKSTMLFFAGLVGWVGLPAVLRKLATDTVLGVPGLGLTLHIMAKKALIDQGIDASKVDFIEVPFAQLNDVLRGGGVDAVATAEPFLGRTVQAKVGSVVEYFFEKLPEETSPVFYVSSADWVAKNKDALARFRLALADAAQFAETNPDKVRPIIGKFVKVPPDVLAAQPLPRLSPQLHEPQVVFWINTLSQQSMLKTKLQAADIVSK